MKRFYLKNRLKAALIVAPFAVLLLFICLCSFTVNKINDDFLKQLGLTKTAADEKISSGIFSGSINVYGLKNAKNILLGNRKAVAIDLLTYTRQYVGSAAFLKQYNQLRESNKPKPSTLETPGEMRTANIKVYKDAIANDEAMLKKADASTKKVFEEVLADEKKGLKEAEDPANKQYTNYAKDYPQLLKDTEASNDAALAVWERNYPSNPFDYVKRRLQEFKKTTADIDFAAELTTKNGKKVFVNPQYEHKSYYWKMAFRAGKEVVEPARAFVQKWIEEIK